MNNITVLHLSDLHFGDENETKAAARTNTLTKLLDTLTNLPAEWKPDTIAISGDMGWNGSAKDYGLAEVWLHHLLKTLGLTPADMILAPGNHDLNRKIAIGIATPTTTQQADDLLDLDLLEIASIPFNDFTQFCQRMHIPPLTLGSKTSYLAGCREHKGMYWLVLNSAWFCRQDREKELYIGLPHLQVITGPESWKTRGTPTIGLLHHPAKYLHDEECYSYGRRITYHFLEEECDLILSGHVHSSLMPPGSITLKSLNFTGGSSYSGEQIRNNISLFRLALPSPVSVLRRAYQWEPGNGTWEHQETFSQSYHLYPPPLADSSRLPVPVEKTSDLHHRLFLGSQRYYENLCGAGGRFRHLDISDVILPTDNKIWLDSTVKESGDTPRNLLYSIPRVWLQGHHHAVVKGDGGMGKTVSMVRLWHEFTREYDSQRPVPVFIQLNEINTVPEDKRRDFIMDTIRLKYFENKVEAENIMDFLRIPRELPAVVLLLDGFNEVTVENRDLLIQINELISGTKSLQVVLTSRYDMRVAYNWEDLELLELQGLEISQIQEYLAKKKIPLPTAEAGLWTLLANPMMLTIYASTCEVLRKSGGHFKAGVQTPGELLWNFIEAQQVMWQERLKSQKDTWWLYRFLLTFMLPAIGFEMEKAGLFALTREHLVQVVEKVLQLCGEPAFCRDYAEYMTPCGLWEMATCAEITRLKKADGIIAILCGELVMMVPEARSYRFLHQHFRDYFAAQQVLLQLEMEVKRSVVAKVLKERALPVYIRRFMGEILGEHEQKPVFVEGTGWALKEDRDSLLNRVLDLCRDVFDGSVGYAPWNIIEVWKEVRGELTGADLSRLDLSRVLLNGSVCSRFYKSAYQAARFDGSLLHERCIFPGGHSREVTSAVYSPDGKKILSASRDYTIKEWDVAGGLCVKTFTGHEDTVTSTSYSPDGKKILSASWDNTIKEWDVAGGLCVKTFIGHTDGVNSARYSPDGKKILSASYDNTIKEWDVAGGLCVKTFTGHTKGVTSARYSPDGKKILSASYDLTIKEWDVAGGLCIKTFTGHTNWVTSARYSPDGKKILSAFRDATIKEWDVAGGLCVKTFTGHNSVVASARYSPDGKKILSASDDHTIKEWDVASGLCVKTFTGHEYGVTSTRYSPDGKKILSASDDNTIKEWDVAAGLCVKTFTGHESEVTSARFSPDGKKILSAFWDHTIKEWDLANGLCVKTFTGHTKGVSSARYSPDGKKILSASNDHTIKEWNVASGLCVKTFTGHTEWVTSARYSPDGKKILSSSWDSTIKEWEVASGLCVKTFTGHTNWVNSARYSPDGKKILSASYDNTIKEWDVAGGLCVKTFTGHTNTVTSARYSPDGEKIFSTSSDDTIKEWDVASGLCLKTSEDFAADIEETEFQRETKTILQFDDNTIEIISHKTEEPIQTFTNIPGLYIQGCSFKNLHPDCDLSAKSRELMRQYGAILKDGS